MWEWLWNRNRKHHYRLLQECWNKRVTWQSVSSPPRSSETSHPDSCCCGQWKQVHFIDAILNAQTYRDEILRPIVVPFIHNHHLMLQHDNARPHVTRICTQFLEAENIPVLAWPAYSPDMLSHWAYLGCSGSAYTTACSSSCQYPATSHSHWRGVDQHSTGHNQQPDQHLCEGDGKWWSHQILTGFQNPLDPHNTVKLHILEWPFIVASLRHTCVIIMLSNQHLDMPHLWGGWIISAKEKCSLTQIYTDLWTIFERNRPFVYVEKVLDLWVQLKGAKTKVLHLKFCSVYIHISNHTILFNILSYNMSFNIL